MFSSPVPKFGAFLAAVIALTTARGRRQEPRVVVELFSTPLITAAQENQVPLIPLESSMLARRPTGRYWCSEYSFENVSPAFLRLDKTDRALVCSPAIPSWRNAWRCQ